MSVIDTCEYIGRAECCVLVGGWRRTFLPIYFVVSEYNLTTFGLRSRDLGDESLSRA